MEAVTKVTLRVFCSYCRSRLGTMVTLSAHFAHAHVRSLCSRPLGWETVTTKNLPCSSPKSSLHCPNHVTLLLDSRHRICITSKALRSS